MRKGKSYSELPQTSHHAAEMDPQQPPYSSKVCKAVQIIVLHWRTASCSNSFYWRLAIVSWNGDGYSRLSESVKNILIVLWTFLVISLLYVSCTEYKPPNHRNGLMMAIDASMSGLASIFAWLYKHYIITHPFGWFLSTHRPISSAWKDGSGCLLLMIVGYDRCSATNHNKILHCDFSWMAEY